MQDNKNGLIIIDKPEGMTSFDVVRQIRRLAQTRKVGHTGTLDPDATGVLPIALGQCTKLSKFLVLDEKEYHFTMKLGASTDTDDASGEVIREAPWEEIEEGAVEEQLTNFVGVIDQVPPIYSAIKIDGKRAYELARAGEEVVLDARKVEVFELELVEWNPPLASLVVRCGPGTYVRSLARDLGEVLGSAAHTVSIRRTRVGSFSVAGAVELEGLSRETFWEQVKSPLEMVSSLPQIEVNEEQEQRVRNGQPVRADLALGIGDALAAHDGEGRLVAVMRCKAVAEGCAEVWPKRVLS